MHPRIKAIADNLFVGVICSVTVGIFFFGSQMALDAFKTSKEEIKAIAAENAKLSEDLKAQQKVFIDAIAEIKISSRMVKKQEVLHGKIRDTVLILDANFDRSNYKLAQDSIKSSISSKIDSLKWDKNWDKKWER